jgi:hypothetical protein
MADNKLLNKAITISGKEEKLQGGKPVIKLKDEKGLTYTVYKTKKDGSTSVAWEQLQELNVGDTVQIGYMEDQGEYEGKTVTYRTIRNFNKDIGEGVQRQQGSQPAETPRSEAPRGSQNNTDWDQIAVGKCQTAFLAAYLQAGNSFADAKLQVIPARKLAELVVYRTQQEELPTITQDDDPAREHNPFVNDPEDIGDNIDF